MRSKGLTLVELLTVIAIIVLIIAFLIPVIVEIRKRGYETTCLANLRQLHIAFTTYLQDYDAEASHQRQLWRYITDKRILVCPADITKEGAATIEANPYNAPPEQMIKTSYFYYRDVIFYSESVLNQMKEKDPNHGIFVCSLHGTPASPPVFHPNHEMKGKVLRLRRDGSVQRAHAEHICFGRDSVVYGFRLWQLFTDVRPIPEEVFSEHPSILDFGSRVECPPEYR